MFMILLILAAALCAGYCILTASIRSGSKFYVIWGLLAVLLAALALMCHLRVWEQLPPGIKRCLVIVVAAGVLIFAVVEGCVLSGFWAKGEPQLDYLIVLGAQVKEDGPSVVLRYRLDAACAYLLENEDTRCIVSGGQGSNEPFSEAEGMCRYLVEKGIPQERILKEDRSRDTSQNIAYSAELIGDRNARVGIVTNNFHVFRGVRLAKHAGFVNVSGIAAPSDPVFLPNNMVREFFGIVKDTVFGNLL